MFVHALLSSEMGSDAVIPMTARRVEVVCVRVGTGGEAPLAPAAARAPGAWVPAQPALRCSGALRRLAALRQVWVRLAALSVPRG